MVEPYIIKNERPGTPPYFIRSKVNSISDWLPVIISNNKKYDYLVDAIEEIRLFVERWQSEFEYQVVDKAGRVLFWKYKEVEVELDEECGESDSEMNDGLNFCGER